MIFWGYFKKNWSLSLKGNHTWAPVLFGVHSPFLRFSRYPALKTDVRSWAATAGDCCAPGKSEIKQPQRPLPCFVFNKKHIQVTVKFHSI